MIHFNVLIPLTASLAELSARPSEFSAMTA